MQYIKLDDLIQYLKDEGEIKSRNKILPEKLPEERCGCCWCHTCGRLYDECVCDSNDWIEAISKMKTIEIESDT